MPEARGVLGRIALHTLKRVEGIKRRMPLAELRAKPLYRRKPLDFALAFEGPGLRVISEIKFASPSEGFLGSWKPSCEEAVRIAGAYLTAGAAALSVLTERHFFAGAPEHLAAVRERYPQALLLMKDFVMDPYQLELALACGADAVLLIAALGKDLRELLRAAKALGLSALVEVHTQEELLKAQEAGARIIGVNCRDLRTLRTDLQVARDLAGLVQGPLLVAESGLGSRAELAELASLGYRGFLVGTRLMKAEDPGQALRELLSG